MLKSLCVAKAKGDDHIKRVNVDMSTKLFMVKLPNNFPSNHKELNLGAFYVTKVALEVSSFFFFFDRES